MPRDRVRSAAVLRAHRRVLEAVGRHAPLEEVLRQLTEEAEAIAPELRCSVLLVEGGCLRLGAAPSLPAAYNAAIDGLAIGPEVGSCGAAAHARERVVASDTLRHPNWIPFRSWIDAAELRACWSEPILDPLGACLGTFAMYYREVHEPDAFELDLISSLAGIAGLAIRTYRLEREREHSERRLRKILDLDPNMLFVKDWEGRFLLANEAAARAYGVTVDDLLGRTHKEFHSDEAELAQMLSDDRTVMTTGRPLVIPEETFVDAEGRRRVLRVTKIPYDFAEGGVRAVLGVAVDISQHKLIEDSLQQSEQRFRQLAEAISEVFWLTDWCTNQVLYVSPAYETVWGEPCQRLYAEPGSWSDAVHPDDRERVCEAFRRGAPQGTYDVEYRIVRSDGGLRWIHDRAFPILDASSEVSRVAGLSEDVTRRKTTELELERALHELEQRSSARLRTLESDLLWSEERERRRLAIDLHDGLNQILTLSQMKLGALESAVAEGQRERVREIAALVDRANRSARSLTFQLSPPILFDLGFEPALQWLAEDVQATYGVRVELVGELEPPTPLEERIRVLLFRAVRELLINVAKHAHADCARVQLERTPSELLIEVSDDGRAFDPGRVGRRGLGLSSIRERLESFGGRMLIESHPGRGTTIGLRAPIRVAVELEDPA